MASTLRAGEADRVRPIVAEELERFRVESPPARPRRWSPSSTSRPRRCAPRELSRFASRLAGLDDAQRDAVDALTRAIVAKLLHEPSVRLRHDAGTPQGERNAAAVSDLFDLH